MDPLLLLKSVLNKTHLTHVGNLMSNSSSFIYLLTIVKLTRIYSGCFVPLSTSFYNNNILQDSHQVCHDLKPEHIMPAKMLQLIVLQSHETGRNAITCTQCVYKDNYESGTMLHLRYDAITAYIAAAAASIVSRIVYNKPRTLPCTEYASGSAYIAYFAL